MRNWKGFIAIWGLAVLLAPVAWAQDPASPDDDPATTDEPAATAPAQDVDQKKGTPFGLYLAAAYGSGSSDDVITTIFADDLHEGRGSVELTEQAYGRGALGWKLPHGKGDFRLLFQGIKEEEFEFEATGRLNFVTHTENNTLPVVDPDSDLVPWWTVTVQNGQLHSVRLIPTWNLDADFLFGNNNGVPEFGDCINVGDGMLRCGEISYDTTAPDREVRSTFPSNLSNRVNVYDAVYGREFGGRRYSSRWWGGLRYFEYEGQLLAGAWLSFAGVPSNFTDGAFLRLLNISQQTTGMGPVGSWEADFNFWNRGLQLYIRGELAFTFNDMKMDSGPYFQVVTPGILLDDRPDQGVEQERLAEQGRSRPANPPQKRPEFRNGLCRRRVPRHHLDAQPAATRRDQRVAADLHPGSGRHDGALRGRVPVLRRPPSRRSNCSQNAGLDLATHSGCSISIPATRSPATAKAIASR